MKRFKILFVTALVAGCSQQVLDNAKYEGDAYKGVKPRDVSINGRAWIMKDNKETHKFILATNYNDAAVDGLREGFTYSLAKDRGTELGEFRPAAEAYVASKQCKIVSGRMMQRHMSEFEYTC
jgi:hypothetical protein